MPTVDPLTLIVCTILGGLIGALLGAAVVIRIHRITVADIVKRVQVQAEVSITPILHYAAIEAPAVVKLDVRIPPLDPVIVPIATAAAPSIQELADRVIGIFPDIGPTDLASIAGCAKSTAHALIAARRPQPAAPQVSMQISPQRGQIGTEVDVLFAPAAKEIMPIAAGALDQVELDAWPPTAPASSPAWLETNRRNR